MNNAQDAEDPEVYMPACCESLSDDGFDPTCIRSIIVAMSITGKIPLGGPRLPKSKTAQKVQSAVLEEVVGQISTEAPARKSECTN